MISSGNEEESKSKSGLLVIFNDISKSHLYQGIFLNSIFKKALSSEGTFILSPENTKLYQNILDKIQSTITDSFTLPAFSNIISKVKRFSDLL